MKDKDKDLLDEFLPTTTTTKGEQPMQPPAPAAKLERKSPRKSPTQFVVMQRIDKLLQSLPPHEKAAVLAWLQEIYGQRMHTADPSPR